MRNAEKEIPDISYLLRVREDRRAAARHRHARRLRRRREAPVDGAPLDRLESLQAVAKLGHFLIYLYCFLFAFVLLSSHSPTLAISYSLICLYEVTRGSRAWPVPSVC